MKRRQEPPIVVGDIENRHSCVACWKRGWQGFVPNARHGGELGYRSLIDSGALKTMNKDLELRGLNAFALGSSMLWWRKPSSEAHRPTKAFDSKATCSACRKINEGFARGLHGDANYGARLR